MSTNSSTLFSHFAASSGAPEKHATDALCYILEHSRTARATLRQFIQQTGVELPSAIHYESQVVCSDGCIPDVVGFDSDGHRHVILDGKFYAKLTSHQPASYVQSLSETAPGIVLFVAPSVRLPNLWRELQVACINGGPPYAELQLPPIVDENTLVDPKATDIDEGTHSITYAQVGRHTLALTSWRYLLATLHHALQAAGEDASAADVQQLQGLCEAMDVDAFLPLQSEELDPARGRRLQQFGDLIDKVLDAVESQPWLSSRGRYGSGAGYFGCNFHMHGHECWLGVSGQLWSTMRAAPNIASPLWLEFYSRRRDEIWALQQRLRHIEHSEPERFHSQNSPELGPSLAVALYLPTGVEEDQVLNVVIRQLNQIAAVLDPFSDSAAAAPESETHLPNGHLPS